MFRRSSNKLAVSSFARFLMDGKGTLTGMPIAKRARLMTAEYNAIKKSPSKFAALVKRAANTPRPKKRVHVPRKAGTFVLFTQSAYEAKVVTGGGKKSIASNAKKVAALWKKYKAAVAAKQGGKPLAKNAKVFDTKLLRSLA